MILYFHGIMPPVAFLKEVFLDLSSFYCISMIYLTYWFQMYKFADGAKNNYSITSHENTAIPHNNLDCLQNWSAKWLLILHIHKYKLMIVTKLTIYKNDIANYYLKNPNCNTSRTSFFHQRKRSVFSWTLTYFLGTLFL